MSDFENLNVMICSSFFGREERDINNLITRTNSQSCENSIEPSSSSNTNSDNEIRSFAVNEQSTNETDPSVNLSGSRVKINHRITQEMNGLMDNLNAQIQRAINEAINE